MPTRTASMTRRIRDNGQALHRARMSRIESSGADQPPSQAESDLLDERRRLKEERDQRKAKALEPRPSAVDRMLRTHRAQPKEKPKAAKDAQREEATRKPKQRKTRAAKQAEKAAAQEAARRTGKKAGK
jgi:hypothetical protein